MIKYFKRFFEGIRIIPKSATTSSNKGDLEVLDSDGRIYFHNGSSNEKLVTEFSTDTLQNKTINANNNTISNIGDSEIEAAAGIQLSKLQTLTGSRVVQTSAGGVLEASNVTATELSYLENVTSDVQTQLNAKLDLAGGTMTGDIVMNANKVTSSATPTGANDLTNKAYVDSVAQGLDAKASVRVATVSPGTLATDFENGDTVDGVVLATNDRILIKNQAAQAENGIYVVQASGAPVRATDANTWDELVSAFVFVEQGTVTADTGWVCTINAGGTIGVNPITFTQFSGAGTITTDGQGLELTGNQLSLELDGTSLSKSATGLKLNSDLVLTGSQITTISANNLLLTTDAGGVIQLAKSTYLNDKLHFDRENDGAAYAPAATITVPDEIIKRITNNSTTTMAGMNEPTFGNQVVIITNASTTEKTLLNESVSAVATRRFVTGTGQDLKMAAGASVWVVYDSTTLRWRIIGGSGGTSRTVTSTYASPSVITAGGGITALGGTDEDIYVASSGGLVNITANPQISAGTLDGQTLRILGTSDTNTILLETGTGLVLNGSWESYAGGILVLRWNNGSSLWTEVSRSN